MVCSMDYIVSKERDRNLAVDLESGGTTSEEEGNKDPVSSVRQTKKLLGRVWSGFVGLDGSIRDENGMNSCINISDSAEVSTENAKLLIVKKLGREELVTLLAKKMEDNCKKTSSKKPPRPPKGPSLDAADQKLVREISELAMLKRARVERMRTQKKMRAAKAASSNTNMYAMIVTVIFCLVIICQGLFSRGVSGVNFQGSPESAAVARGGMISVQYHKNLLVDGSGSGSPNLVEQVSGSSPEEGGRVAG